MLIVLNRRALPDQSQGLAVADINHNGRSRSRKFAPEFGSWHHAPQVENLAPIRQAG
jgi:hypothetical protein